MRDVSTLRLYLSRAMYLLIAVGLGVTVWPEITAPPEMVANSSIVVRSLLGALAVLALVGIRYLLQMLPLLIFELLWKVVWVVAFATPLWMNKGLDEYARDTLFACLKGVILVPLVLPWGYLRRHYVKSPAEPWSASNS